jgi:hypothetical protein
LGIVNTFPLNFSYPYLSLIRQDLDGPDTFPDREGYNIVEFVLEMLCKPHPSGLDVLTPSHSGEGYNVVEV